MINESDYTFGLDGSRYWSSNGLADFKVLAQARNPTVRFLAFRASISWGYTDPFFGYHWKEAAKIADYRKALVYGAPEDFYLPVGRCAYGVIWPGEDGRRQAHNLLKSVEDQGVDWNHDRLVIDLELHHNQTPRRITDSTNLYGKTLKEETGRWPFLYMRYYWTRDHTIVDELYPFPMWYAQYLTPIPGFRYRAEYPPPPNPIFEDRGWTVHQTAERGRPQPYGVTGKQVIDYDRWNGGYKEVLKFFGIGEPTTPPPQIGLTELIDMHEHPEKHPPIP